MASKNRFSSKPQSSLLPWLGIAAFIILLDQVTKIAITKTFHLGDARPITSFFNLVLAKSGQELRVEEGMSILKAIEKANVDVECLCREGVCGTCETRILEGQAEHNDQYLSDDEKAAQQTMMICVSRARGERLVLDL